MSNHQASNNRGVPAVMQLRVKEPGDPARLEMRGPAGAGEGRRGGTGDGGRGETGSAGSEEMRVKSEKGGPDIRRPPDVREPVCQSAGRGEMTDRSQIGDRDRRARSVPKRSKPSGIGFWRMEMQPELEGGVRRKEKGPNDPDSKMMRGSASPGEGKDHISVSEAAEKLRLSFGSLPPPTLSKLRADNSDREGFFSLSGHFVQKQRSPYSTQQKRKSPPVTRTKDLSGDRFAEALDLVGRVNRFSRQKRGGFLDIGKIESSGNCPLCDLKCHCLGKSCLQKKGISDE